MLSNKSNIVLKRILFAVIISLCIYIFLYGDVNFTRELQRLRINRNPATLDAKILVTAFEQDLSATTNSELLAVVMNSNVTTTPSTVAERIKQITQCIDRTIDPRIRQRGNYWVLYNYIRAQFRYKCEDTITYTTHGDYSFLDNLVPLLERWQGPISIAIHAPGSDFQNTLDSIAYLRDCASPLVKQFTTFHIYFSTEHIPQQVPHYDKVLQETFNCSLNAPYLNVSSQQMYKTQKELLYPVNVGRNIARESASTHFILASDIELYPSPNLIPKFLEMVAENHESLIHRKPHVFPLHLFEVGATQPVPKNKTHLKEMLAKGNAMPFHKKLCPSCHNIPKSKEWQASNETEDMHVFHVGKRMDKFIHWEPIFIGTHADPFYDERLSWEGQSDKMTQGYALCVMDYNFMILDNAFLVHKPGFKVYKKDKKRNIVIGKTNYLIKKIIVPELKIFYGVREGCAV